MCTHYQCFKQKQEKYNILSPENYHFTAMQYRSILHGHVCVMVDVSVEAFAAESPLTNSVYPDQTITDPGGIWCRYRTSVQQSIDSLRYMNILQKFAKIMIQ